MAGTLQYGRVCELIVGTGGSGLLIKDPIRIKFQVTKSIGRTPNVAQISIYNLSSDTENRIRKEFDEVLLNGGYVGATRLIFRGNIKHTSAYRDGTDRIIEIDAADGDKDFRTAYVNTTLVRGSTTSQLIDQVVGSFASTKKGHVKVNDAKRSRGRVISGMARDVLDSVATENDAHWSIQDGNLVIVPVDSTLPTEAIVLRSDTGMLGAPEVDDKGVKVKCLLNPAILPNGKIQIDNNDLKLKIAKQRVQAPGANKPATTAKKKELARLDPDGIYKAYKVVHTGDNRAPQWETETSAVGLLKSIPAGREAA